MISNDIQELLKNITKSLIKIETKELDALDECMRDLSWIQEKEIILNFNNINKLKDRNSELYHLIHDALSFYKQYWEENNHEKIVTINF